MSPRAWGQGNSNCGLISLQEINGITAALAEELFEKGMWPGVPKTVATRPDLSGSRDPGWHGTPANECAPGPTSPGLLKSLGLVHSRACLSTCPPALQAARSKKLWSFTLGLLSPRVRG